MHLILLLYDLTLSIYIFSAVIFPLEKFDVDRENKPKNVQEIQGYCTVLTNTQKFLQNSVAF
jgi:hypothetical protein